MYIYIYIYIYRYIIIDNNQYIPGLFVDNIKHDIFTLVAMSCQSDKSKQISSNLVVMGF